MSKIAFFVQHMLCGGVENALIALTDKLTNAGNDVTIYVIVGNGDFLSRIPNEIQVLKIPMSEKMRQRIPVGGAKLAFRNNMRNQHYLLAMYNLKSYFFGETEFSELNVNFTSIPILQEKYDVAVNFHMHSPFLVRYLSEKVMAYRKYTWIHNDFTTTKYNIKSLKKYLDCNDGFFAVAQNLVNQFSVIFPEYKNKTELALNIVPSEAIIEKGNAYYPDEYKKIPDNILKLLSVGRLEQQKGYDLTIAVCKKLVSAGYRFQWFVLGEGSEREKLERKLQKEGIQEILHFLGIRMNPYPYFKNCDIYVQTSRHEGYVTTVTEAKLFNRPIVCTDVSGAQEQLLSGVNGDIAEINEESIYNLLSRLLGDPKRRLYYSEQLETINQAENYDYSYMRIFK